MAQIMTVVFEQECESKHVALKFVHGLGCVHVETLADICDKLLVSRKTPRVRAGHAQEVIIDVSLSQKHLRSWVLVWVA